MSELVDELRGAEDLILSVTGRSDWKSVAEHFRKAADRIEELERENDELRALVSDAMEGDSEFLTEWDERARKVLSYEQV